ncbi:MAG: OmpA family protein [Planctomycetes bacterium]|nr:OmpA family protein [Planctomycetota bacterium]
MKKIVMSLVALSTMALLGSGCVSLDEYNRTAAHLQTEQEANIALSAENTRLEGEVNKARVDRETLTTTIKELRTQLENSPKIGEDEIVNRIKEIWGEGLGGNDKWEYVQSGGAVGVRMDDSGVLFKSGSWDLTDNTKSKLTELAGIIAKKVKTDATLFVRVDGHTDSDPVKKLKTKGINDNIHLSTMRAMAVRDFLVSKGVPQDRVFVAGFGEFWPIAAGKSAKDKQRNRRVEVYLGDPDALSIGALPGAQVAK